MSLLKSLEALNNVDLSPLAQRLADLQPPAIEARIDAQIAKNQALPPVDETWVRQNVLPVITKVTRLSS